MALKLNERYPGRFNNPTSGYPQGSFKNRTTPTAKDGSHLEQDWANDKEGLFQSLLEAAGVEANGTVDAVGSSQYFDAMIQVIEDSTPQATEAVLGGGKVATQTQTDTGTDDLTLVTPKKLMFGFSILLNASIGYIRFPSWCKRFTIAWGTALNNTPTTFPIGFTAAPRVTGISPAASPTTSSYSALSATSATFQTGIGNSTSYIAVGFS